MYKFKDYIQETKIQLQPKKLKIKDVIVGTYKQNADGSYDIKGSVNISYMNLTKIPWKFNKVSGYFECMNNKLNTLENCPKIVKGQFFSCSGNQLTSLEHCPKIVNGDFYCGRNKKEFTKKEVEKYCKVEGDISV